MNETDTYTINVPKPVCILYWKGDDELQYGAVSFQLYRDFNKFQQFMLRVCLGLYYKKL